MSRGYGMMLAALLAAALALLVGPVAFAAGLAWGEPGPGWHIAAKLLVSVALLVEATSLWCRRHDKSSDRSARAASGMFGVAAMLGFAAISLEATWLALASEHA